MLQEKNLVRALNHMMGTLLICDRDRNVVYYNTIVCSALNIPEERLRGANLMELIDEGWILNSASAQAFDTKQLSIKYVRGKMEVPILTVSNPVLDENGEVELVVAVSFDERITELVTREMVESRTKSVQLLDYLSGQLNSAEVIAESGPMKRILALISRVATVDSNILLTGETGAGKEVLAKYIHSQSRRSGEVFLPVNCAAIPESLMESEFFGYVKGAFTGANKEGKAGIFELADGGTVFLDEVGEMPLMLQAKFLRVIETGEVTRLGATASKKVNFRLLAATNRDLEAMCAKGLFRSDLYYRMNILSIEIPPLRERREDIIPLAKFFLDRLNKKYGETKLLSHAAAQRLRGYSWPGNVRELRNIIERLFITSPTHILQFDQGYDALTTAPVMPKIPQEVPSVSTKGQSLRESVKAYEKRLILEALDACGGNVANAAQQLKLHKSVLYRKLETYRNEKTLGGSI